MIIAIVNSVVIFPPFSKNTKVSTFVFFEKVVSQ